MVAHPKTMQTVIDQRWHELRVETQRERITMTAREQTPAVAPTATLRLHVINAVRMLPPIFGGRLNVAMPRNAQRPAVP